MTKNISRTAVVVSSSGTYASVRVGRQSACSQCVSRGACRAEGSRNMLVRAKLRGGMTVEPGMVVSVSEPCNAAWAAVTLAYGLPLVVMVAAVCVASVTGSDEIFAALSALVVVAMYYAVLYSQRGRLGLHFEPVVERILESNG